MSATTAAVTAETATAPLDVVKQSIENRLRSGGFMLLELGDGSFVITKWGYIRPVPDLFTAAKFAEGAGL